MQVLYYKIFILLLSELHIYIYIYLSDKSSESHTPNNGVLSDFKNGKSNLSSSPSIISSMLEGKKNKNM